MVITGPPCIIKRGIAIPDHKFTSETWAYCYEYAWMALLRRAVFVPVCLCLVRFLIEGNDYLPVQY